MQAALGDVVGGAQRQLPMHAVQEYCRTDRSFDPCPDFSQGQRGREFKVYMYYNDSWHQTLDFKRSHWFPTPGVREVWDGDEKLGWLRAVETPGGAGRMRYAASVGCTEDWRRAAPRGWCDRAAMDDLFNVRKNQFRALGESLSQAPHMSR